jgi:hypothetical protein
MRLAKSILFSPLTIGICLFLYLQLPVATLGISMRDEGLYYYYASEILRGKVPSRDFLIILSPGSYYLQALLINIFGNYLLLGRIFYIFWTILLFTTSYVTFPLKKTYQYIIYMALPFLFYLPGGVAGYNIEGITMAVIALLVLKTGLEKKKNSLLFLSGLISGCIFIIKQSPGVTCIPLFLLVAAFFAYEKRQKSIFISYALGLLVPLSLFFGYFYFQNSLPQLFYYSFVFSSKVKSHAQKFLAATILLTPVLYGAFLFFNNAAKKIKLFLLGIFSLVGFGILLFFAKDFSHITKYIAGPMYPLLIFLYVLPIFAISKIACKKIKTEIYFFASCLLICLYIGLSASGKSMDPPKLLSPLAFPVAVFVIEKMVRAKYVFATVLCVIAIYTFAAFQNPFNAHTLVYGVYPKHMLTQPLELAQGKYIKVSKSENDDLKKTTSFIFTHTPKNGKIICFPYCLLLYDLVERESASYFSFFYFEQFMDTNQKDLIRELNKKRADMVVLQKKGEIEPEALFEDKRLATLKKYFVTHYKKVYETNNFVLYQ